MEEQQKHIDDLFREELGNYAETPPAAVWDALEPRLEEARKRRPFGGWLPWIVMLLLVGTVAGFFIVRNGAKKSAGNLVPIDKELVSNEFSTIHTDSTDTNHAEKANTTIQIDTQKYRTHYDAAAVHLHKAASKQSRKTKGHNNSKTLADTTLDATTVVEPTQTTKTEKTQHSKDAATKAKAPKQQSANVVPVQPGIDNAGSSDASGFAGSNSSSKTGEENSANNSLATKNKKATAGKKQSNTKATTIQQTTNAVATKEGNEPADQNSSATTTKTKAAKKKTTQPVTAANNKTSQTPTVADNNSDQPTATNNTTDQGVAQTVKKSSKKKTVAKTIVPAATITSSKENTATKASNKKKPTVTTNPAAVASNTADTDNNAAATNKTNNKKTANKKTKTQTSVASNNSTPTTSVATNTSKKKTTKTPKEPVTTTATSGNTNVAAVASSGNTVKSKSTKQPADQKTDAVAANTGNKKPVNKKTKTQTSVASDNNIPTTPVATNTSKKKTTKIPKEPATTTATSGKTNVAVVPSSGNTTKPKNTKQPADQKTNAVAANTDNKKQPTTVNNNNQKKTNNTPSSINPSKPQGTPSSKEEAKPPISVMPAPNDPKTALQIPVNGNTANKPQQTAGADNAPPKAKPERDPRAGILVSDYLDKSEEAANKTQKTGEADEEEQKVTAAANGGGGGGATAQPTKKPHNPSPLEGGAKIGYETGFNSYTASKWVGALYLQYNISKKASFVIQPAVKLAQTNSSSTSNSNQSYYNVTGTNVSHSVGGVQFDSTTGRTDTLYNYIYRQNYDSVGVKKTVARNYVEIELPIIFKYEVAPNFSLLAGLTMGFGALPKTTENTTTYGSYVLQDTVNNIKNNPNYQINVNDSFSHAHTSAPYSSYTPTSTSSSNPIRFGYILGMNYMLKDRFLFDVTVQQNFSKQPNIQNTDVRSLITQPYVRVMVGYKFFKPKKKVVE